MASLWDDVLSAELASERARCEDIAACEAERTPSTCAECAAEAQTGPEERRGRGPKPAAWWAVLLKAAGTALGVEDAGPSTSQSPTIQVVSGCTGCSAESFVLQASLGCRVSELSCLQFPA